MRKETTPNMSWEMMELRSKYFLDETRSLKELESFLSGYIIYCKNSHLVTDTEKSQMDEDYKRIVEALSAEREIKGLVKKRPQMSIEMIEIRDRYSLGEKCTLRKLESFLLKRIAYCENNPAVAGDVEIQVIRDYNSVAEALSMERQKKKLAEMDKDIRRKNKRQARALAA